MVYSSFDYYVDPGGDPAGWCATATDERGFYIDGFWGTCDAGTCSGARPNSLTEKIDGGEFSICGSIHVLGRFSGHSIELFVRLVKTRLVY